MLVNKSTADAMYASGTFVFIALTKQRTSKGNWLKKIGPMSNS